MEAEASADPTRALLTDILRAFATGEHVDDVLHGCCQSLVDQLDAAFARVWVHDRREKTLVLRASAGLYTHLDGPHGTVRVGSFKIGRIARDRRPHLTNDVQHDDEISNPEWAAREGIRAFAGYPLLAGDRLVGVVALFARHELSEYVLGALATMAEAIAAGIERMQSSDRARDALQTLHRIGRALVAELDLDAVVQTVTDAATELSGARFGAFFYNVDDGRGGSYTLYTLSGAQRAAFDGFGLPRNTPIFQPTFSGGPTLRLDDVTADRRFGLVEPHFGLPEGHPPVRSYLATPVVARDGEVLGGLFFGHPEPGVFDESHELLVSGIAGYAAVAIENARHYQEEHAIALALQRSLLPGVVATVPGFDVTVHYSPATARAEVGGDWYDLLPVGEGRFVVTVGDVVGHNIEAAGVMGTIRGALRLLASQSPSPQESLPALDRYLLADGRESMMATLLYVLVDPEQETMEMASMGHPPPLIVGGGGARFLDVAPNPPVGLGLLDADRMRTTTCPLPPPGSTLVLYTDGLVERANEPIDRSLERLADTADRLAASSAHDGAAFVSAVVEAMVHPSARADDVAVLALTRHPA